jgi:hypothetical protein
MSGSLFADAFRRRSALAAKTAEDAEVLARFAARFVETLKGGGPSSSRATAGVPPTRSISRPSMWSATRETGGRWRRSR